MSADFWAGYISGAAGIIIGNPLDLIKVRLQAGQSTATSDGSQVDRFRNLGTLVKGAAAPILGYGALNALLFMSYNRTLIGLGDEASNPTSAWKIWLAGATGGLATWVVSAPTELVKCRAQVSSHEQSSWTIARDIFKSGGIKGLYVGGVVTSLRDSIGYGFYFWSYELSKQWITGKEDTDMQKATKVLLCGGFAGVVTWASIFPLDVIKTRVQTQPVLSSRVTHCATNTTPLVNAEAVPSQLQAQRSLGALEITRQAYNHEGYRVFFRGLGICSARAFVVNAVQWAVYEAIMNRLR